MAGNPLQGAKAGALAGTFAAVADDPSAIAHNPAGLSSLEGTNIYSGVSALAISSEYESHSGETADTESPLFFPPHLYLATDAFGDEWSFGVGIHSPFGIGGTKWDRQGLTRYVSTESIIGTLSLNPTVAWKPFPSLSIGVGAVYMGAWDIEERMVDQSMVGGGDGKLSFEGDGDGWGYDLGVLLFPEKELSVGLTYASRVKVTISGDTKLEGIAPQLQPAFGGSSFKTDTKTRVEFPETASLGFAYRPTKALTIALDFEWVGWSVFDEGTYDFEDEVPEAGFVDVTADLDWDDAWRIKAGIDYKVNESLSLRCGYGYLEGQVPEQSLSPAFPSTDNHNVSVGVGYTKGPWVLDAFYLAEIFEDLTVENEILTGTYESLHHFFGFSVGYGF
jgi:long-chain fatty acid transport protein